MPTLSKLLIVAGAALALLPAAHATAAPPPVYPSGPRPIPVPTPPRGFSEYIEPSVVSLGDSAISGEAGRWAGNTNRADVSGIDTGADAYNDNASGTGEAIPGCHRAKSAEVHIGAGLDGKPVASLNLACSGAKTYTYFDGGGEFKPGIDFYSDASGRKGQALALQEYAAAHPHSIKAVAVLIDANDYGFSEVAETCVQDWLLSPSWLRNYCQDDGNLTAMFSPGKVATNTLLVRQAFVNIHTAMANAGYADPEYRIIAQTYSSLIPKGYGFRYPETGYTRQGVGGCGIWDADATWSNDEVMATFNSTITDAVSQAKQGGAPNIDVLDASQALNGHRLCETGVGLLEEQGLSDGRAPGSAEKVEWVNQARTLSTLGNSPFQFQEGGHPNYWAQLALRNCLRQAYNNGSPHGGACVSTGNFDSQHNEPGMTLK